MKAQEYVNQYLPQINEASSESEMKAIGAEAFVTFLEDTASMVKARKAVSDDAVISIINEESDKWHKFCRLMNEGQTAVKFNEDMFLNYWKERLDLE